MSDASNAAFEDLELDVSNMMADPDKFATEVYAKAEELREILKQDHSVNGLLSEYNSKKVPAETSIVEQINEVYNMAETLPLNMVPSVIETVEQLLRDLKTQFRDRVTYTVAELTGSNANKKTAHAQYTALREKFNLYVRFMDSILGKSNLKLLPALPGNYGMGVSSLKQYVWTKIETNESYRNHRVVIGKINAEFGEEIPRDTFLTDFLEMSDKLAGWGWTLKEFV